MHAARVIWKSADRLTAVHVLGMMPIVFPTLFALQLLKDGECVGALALSLSSLVLNVALIRSCKQTRRPVEERTSNPAAVD